MRVPRRQFEREQEQRFKVALHLKLLSAMGARERRWIENNHIELLAASRQAGQDGENLVGDELMAGSRKAVQREILASARQRFLRQVNADRRGVDIRSRHGK